MTLNCMAYNKSARSSYESIGFRTVRAFVNLEWDAYESVQSVSGRRHTNFGTFRMF
jgi:hypothetical protein